MLLRPFLRPSTHTTSSIINLLHAPSTPTRTLRTFAHPSSRIAARLAPTPATQRHPLLLTTIALTTLSTPFLARTTIYNDGPLADFSSTASNEAKSPLSKDGGKNLSPTVVRQMSMGALCGLGLGVVVSAFSKMIVLVVGLGIVIVQYAARRGIRLIPEGTLQRYVRGINVRGMINENAAFKISFGLMFAMTAFGHI